MATTSKDSGYVDNWQTGKTVTECNLHMLETEDCSDVIFRVGSEQQMVRAHRYVLVSRSCVFHAMFCGPLAEKGEVTIPDIEREIFRDFLRYIYTDDVKITAENVTGLLYTSRKYGVDGLLNQCAAFIEKSLTEENVCQILEQCHSYGELDLEQKAFSILIEAGDQVVKSLGFQNLCRDCLGKLLKSERLDMTEEALFEGTLSWTKLKCQEDKLPVTHENILKYLGELRFEIQFGSMSLDYLSKVVGPSEMLTRDERLNIMDSILQENVNISPFKSSERKRKSVVNKYVHRFQGTPYKAVFDAGPHMISFSCNRNLQLAGCQIYGPNVEENRQYNVKMQLVNSDDEVISESISDMILQGGGEHNNVLFPRAVPVDKGSTYTISVALPTTRTWCGRDGRRRVHVDEIEFTFANHKQSGISQITHGQIPGLIFQQ